jgi:hypothetical protein
MESKYGDDDVQPSSFSPLSPFVTTIVLKVSFCEVECCVVLSLAPSRIWWCLAYVISLYSVVVVVFTLVVFLWIPYQDLADKEETTQNEEAAREEEPREETNASPQNDQGADTLNVDSGDINNGVGRENDRGANIRQVNSGAAIGSGAVIGSVLCLPSSSGYEEPYNSIPTESREITHYISQSVYESEMHTRAHTQTHHRCHLVVNLGCSMCCRLLGGQRVVTLLTSGLAGLKEVHEKSDCIFACTKNRMEITTATVLAHFLK